MLTVCYGDSNTYGYDPRDVLGEPYLLAWPELLAKKTGWTVHNEGENGREIPSCPMQFSKDIDLLIILLGTNDLLQARSAKDVAVKMEGFVATLKKHQREILLISPPPLVRGAWVASDDMIRESEELTKYYREIAARMGIHFADSAEWQIPLAFDGVHFTEEGHRVFACELYTYLEKEGLVE